MSKARPKGRQAQQAEGPQDRRWLQILVVAGVVLLAAALLLVKDRTAAPVVLDLEESQAAAGEDNQGDVLAAEPGELPQAHLERLLAAGQPTLAFFHSNSCVQCTKMMEVVADVYPEFEGAVALVDVDVYDPANRVLLQQAGIRAIPTQIFFNAAGEGELVVGAIPSEAFRTYMQSVAGEE